MSKNSKILFFKTFIIVMSLIFIYINKKVFEKPDKVALINYLNCLDNDYVQLNEETSYLVKEIDNNIAEQNIYDFSKSTIVQNFFKDDFVAFINDKILITKKKGKSTRYSNDKDLKNMDFPLDYLNKKDLKDNFLKIIEHNHTEVEKITSNLFKIKNQDATLIHSNIDKFFYEALITIKDNYIIKIEQTIHIADTKTYSENRIVQTFNYKLSKSYDKIVFEYIKKYNLSLTEFNSNFSFNNISSVLVNGQQLEILSEIKEFSSSDTIENTVKRKINNKEIIVETRKLKLNNATDNLVIDVIKLENQYLIVGINTHVFHYLSVTNNDSLETIKNKLKSSNLEIIEETKNKLTYNYLYRGVKYEITFTFIDNQTHLYIKVI